MTTGEWISTLNLVFMTGSAIFLAANRWVNTRASTETKLTRDLAENERMQTMRDGALEGGLRKVEARVEQVHIKAGDRMDRIDLHIHNTDLRIQAIETTLKVKGIV